MPNQQNQYTQIISHFYKSFQKLNAVEMAACYHPDVVFEDPAFGVLQGERAKQMWHMLVARGKDSLQITFGNIVANENRGSAHWTATYLYGKGKRKVSNRVKACFEFKDGKIIKHTDEFDLWKWSRQALGFSGYILGWSGFMKQKIQETTNVALDKYINSKT